MDAKKQKGVASSGEPIAFDKPAILMMSPEAYFKAIKQARNDAREEAAKVAEKLWRGNRHQLPYDEGIDDASEKIAQAIRALKEK